MNPMIKTRSLNGLKIRSALAAIASSKGETSPLFSGDPSLYAHEREWLLNPDNYIDGRTSALMQRSVGLRNWHKFISAYGIDEVLKPYPVVSNIL